MAAVAATMVGAEAALVADTAATTLPSLSTAPAPPLRTNIWVRSSTRPRGRAYGPDPAPALPPRAAPMIARPLIMLAAPLLSSKAPTSASNVRSDTHAWVSISAKLTRKQSAALSMSDPNSGELAAASSFIELGSLTEPPPLARPHAPPAPPLLAAAAAAASRDGPAPGTRPSRDAHQGTSAAAAAIPPAARTAAHPAGFSLVRLVSTCTTARKVPAAIRGSTPSPLSRADTTPQMVAPARVACVAAAVVAASVGRARRSEWTIVHFGDASLAPAPTLSSSSAPDWTCGIELPPAVQREPSIAPASTAPSACSHWTAPVATSSVPSSSQAMDASTAAEM
mmetsp:Transcript_22388/g.55334  ORF Transcript_22388/g.55334 Transcript_22388/m.55334 type:complete len:339 (-) Transcript_22388:1346-2362(-)